MTLDELHAELRSQPRLALYLTIDSCGPCHAVRPWVEGLFGADPGWAWLPVDTAASPEIAGQMLVFAHPTLLLFTEGQERARFSRILRREAVERAKAALEG